MKMKLIFVGFVFFLHLDILEAQNSNTQNYCASPNTEFCPGNFFQNGDFEQVTGDPNAQRDTDIGLAVGWEAMWNATNTMADLNCNGGSESKGSAPIPNTNVYAAMWIENRTKDDSRNFRFREGMYNKLATKIGYGTGNYTFNFLMANSELVSALGPVSIGIYGVYNPDEEIADPPTGGNSHPTNIDLWKSVSSTVKVVLLGTISTPNTFTNSWIPQSITFNSNILPSNGITHIMITLDDKARPSSYRKLYINFDEFCLQRAAIDPSVYCCGGTNLIPNGNFESGTEGFESDYDQVPLSNPIFPGGFTVIGDKEASSKCENWKVKDHTNCINGSNSHVLIVNGKTQQASNVDNTIWQTASPIKVEPDSQYRFCAYVKHLSQCCFDITPIIKIEVRHNGATSWNTLQNWIPITYTGGDFPPCDWEEIGGTFTTSSNSVEIRILIDEVGNGDGNDLALDDISLQKQQVTPPSLSDFTFTQTSLSGNNYGITANAVNPLPPGYESGWIIGKCNADGTSFQGWPVF